MKEKEVQIEDLLGKIIISIEGNIGDDVMTITTSDNNQYRLYHDQDCCENVDIQDIIGDLNDLLNTPILQAEEVTNSDDTFGKIKYPDSFTWTFYKLATIKGYVTISWLGESNGYYSESVSIVKYIND
jgi:hypothetical protein